MNVDWHHDAAPIVLPQLSQSAWCFDPIDVAKRLPRGLLDVAAGNLRIVAVRHRPGRSLDVTYEIGQAGRSRQVISVSYFTKGRSARAYEKAVAAARTRDAVVHADQMDAVIFLFPEDSGLPHLGDLLSWPPPDRPLDTSDGPADWSLLSYRRGERCVIRRHSGDGTSDVVVRCHEDAATAHAICSVLFETAGHRYVVPQPLACDPTRNLRCESFLRGERFSDTMTRNGMAAVIDAALPALVALHGTRLASALPSQSPATILKRLNEVVVKRATRASPEIGELCSKMADRLAQSAPNATHASTLHGDLHTGNIIFVDGRCAFIDLDNLAIGSPAIDLAMLASRMLLHAMLEPLDHGQDALSVIATLPERYNRCGGDHIERDAYAWFLAALIVERQVKTCINHAAPGLEGLCAHLIAASRHILDQNGTESFTLPW